MRTSSVFALGILGLVLSQGLVQAQTAKMGSIDWKATATSVDPKAPRLTKLTLSNQQLESLVRERQASVASLKKEVAELKAALDKVAFSYSNVLQAWPQFLHFIKTQRQGQVQPGNKGSSDWKATATSVDPKAPRLPFPGQKLTLSNQQLQSLVWELQASVASLQDEVAVEKELHGSIFASFYTGGKARRIVGYTLRQAQEDLRLKRAEFATAVSVDSKAPRRTFPGQNPTLTSQQMESLVWKVQESVASLRIEVALQKAALHLTNLQVENWKFVLNLATRGSFAHR